jgi:hypothetical protein
MSSLLYSTLRDSFYAIRKSRKRRANVESKQLWSLLAQAIRMDFGSYGQHLILFLALPDGPESNFFVAG